MSNDPVYYAVVKDKHLLYDQNTDQLEIYETWDSAVQNTPADSATVSITVKRASAAPLPEKTHDHKQAYILGFKAGFSEGLTAKPVNGTHDIEFRAEESYRLHLQHNAPPETQEPKNQ